MKVIIRAPLLSLSGYGIHSRQVFEWLESLPGIELNVEIVQWGRTAWILNQDQDDEIVKRIISKSKPQKEGIEYDYSFQVQLPDEWDPSIAKHNVGISAFVETDRCNPVWIEKCNEMDAIIVPSTFTKNVAKRSGVLRKPIYVVPEWFNEKIELESIDPIDLKLRTKFNYLMIGTITAQTADEDRKNIFYAIKWFCEKFKDDKRVGLVLKTSYGKGTKIDRQLTKTAIRQVLGEVREGKFPKVHLLHGNLNQEEIASLYRHPKIKGVISATKGEGYGLPLVEGAASGLPIVVTGWSGHTEFLEKGKYLDVDYTLKEITETRIDGRVFVEGTRWADVNERDFKRKIKDLKDRYSLHSKNAKKMQKSIHENFSKKAVMEKYNQFFDEFKRNI